MFVVYARDACRKDIPHIMGIDDRSELIPWDEGELVQMIDSERFSVGVSLPMKGTRVTGPPVSYYVLLHRKRHSELLCLVVDPDWRRSAVGSRTFTVAAMTSRQMGKRGMKALVYEHNTPAQIFLKSVGMEYHATRKGLCSGEDAYEFRMRFMEEPTPSSHEFSRENRSDARKSAVEMDRLRRRK